MRGLRSFLAIFGLACSISILESCLPSESVRILTAGSAICFNVVVRGCSEELTLKCRINCCCGTGCVNSSRLCGSMTGRARSKYVREGRADKKARSDLFKQSYCSRKRQFKAHSDTWKELFLSRGLCLIVGSSTAWPIAQRITSSASAH